MAKARDIPGLRADMTFAEAAAATVAVRADELFAHGREILDTSDIERVHDMRVASRRLRAVLEIYRPCFPDADLKPLPKAVKALADALGERRDPDVLLDRLRILEEGLTADDVAGVEAFAEPVREEQARGNMALADALDEAERAADTCFGPYAATALKRVKDVQDLLGELHDCDVQLPRVLARAEELRAADVAEARARAGTRRWGAGRRRPPPRPGAMSEQHPIRAIPPPVAEAEPAPADLLDPSL